MSQGVLMSLVVLVYQVYILGSSCCFSFNGIVVSTLVVFFSIALPLDLELEMVPEPAGVYKSFNGPLFFPCTMTGGVLPVGVLGWCCVGSWTGGACGAHCAHATAVGS